MSKGLKVPECVQFNRAVWNSEPFHENFLYDLKARRYYLLDDSGCRNALINLFSILDFWILQTESQPSVRTIFSSLCIILAVNIRESESVPLTQSFDEEEFATDPPMPFNLEQPISKKNQVSEEIQNAVRSVRRFDIVAPALAWAIVRFLVGKTAVAETVNSELHRWKQDGSIVQNPRGCVAFLERKLPFVKNFSFLPYDVATLVKATAVFLKDDTLGTGATIKRQLATFTRCFVDRDLGPWVPLEEIAGGNLNLQSALIESFQEHSVGTPRLAQSISNLSLFHDNIAKHFDGFKLHGHYVYCVYKSCMFSYLSGSIGQNSELTAEINGVRDVLSEVRNLEDLDCDVSDEKLAETGLKARRRAKCFLMALNPEDRGTYLSREYSENRQSSVDATHAVAQTSTQSGKRKKRRKKKN